MRGRTRSFKEYPPCDKCGSTENVVGYGKRTNKYETKQVYYCKKCKHKFTPDNGFKKRFFPSEVILFAVKKSKEGCTFQEVIEEVEDQYEITVGKTSIYKWVKEYGEMVDIK
ncbi:MAG: hypothetical protein PVF58_00710 [Candidatus Methanofastidiosia archaeon]|jgi:transposase-like protein